MRYSIRSLLIVTTYIAIAAAAIGTRSYLLTDLVWAATLFALVYVALLAVLGEGKCQAMAIGFVLLSVIHILCVYLILDRVPAMRVLSAIGFAVTITGKVYESGNSGVLVSPSINMVSIIRTSHALGTLVAGLIGCLIGNLTYQQTEKDQVGRDRA